MLNVTEVYEDNQKFSLREILVNPDHISHAREDYYVPTRIKETNSLLELNDHVSFTRLFIDRGNMGTEIVIVGSIADINKKFNKLSQKVILKD
jgi:hypothetical protein